MKRYIKSNTSAKQTLREYLVSNKSRLQNCKIIVADETPYPGAESDEQGYIDCPGVLFDGTYDEIINSDPVSFENNTSDDNYLDQTDLDRCTVVRTSSGDFGEEIIITGFFR